MSKSTVLPMPKWGTLLKALFLRSINESELVKIWKTDNKDFHYWFSRSAFAILTIAQWWKVNNNNRIPTIWVPDYFCDQSLQLLRNENFPIYFYPINKHLMPDWEKCKIQAKTILPDIFILVHYFGYPSDLHQAKIFCDEFQSVFVEDAAHVLKPEKGIGTQGDFVFYSPYKLLPISAGSLLIQRIKSKKILKLARQNNIVSIKEVIQKMPKKVPSSWIWLLKRLLQKLLPNFIFIWLKKYNKVEKTIKSEIPFKPILNRFGKKLLFIESKNIGSIGVKRQINYSMFNNLANCGTKKPLINKKEFTPFTFGLRFCKQGEAKYYYKLFQENNLPVMKWPDLPPEIMSNKKKHPHANNLFDTNLFFPVHQTLKNSTLVKISDLIHNNNCYKLLFENIDSIKWEDLLNQVNNPNLMQTWGYGEAKRKVNGWSVKRVMITYKDQPIAIFQSLEKKWCPIGIIRINRGPLFLGDIDNTSKYYIYKTLRKLSCWRKFRIILIAPNLYDTEENIAIMKLAGYKKIKKKPQKSILINLTKTDDSLRKDLNGKWRNQLKKSEKYGLSFKMGNTVYLHNWLMKKYKQLMIDKSFVGPNIELYSELHNFRKKDSVILQAWLRNVAVAGILITKHGSFCSYQVGWSSLEGRKVYANNFLLWNSIVEMKKQGYASFDLGGINEDLTPGITRFKRGLGGVEYQLVGEWASFDTIVI